MYVVRIKERLGTNAVPKAKWNESAYETADGAARDALLAVAGRLRMLNPTRDASTSRSDVLRTMAAFVAEPESKNDGISISFETGLPKTKRGVEVVRNALERVRRSTPLDDRSFDGASETADGEATFFGADEHGNMFFETKFDPSYDCGERPAPPVENDPEDDEKGTKALESALAAVAEAEATAELVEAICMSASPATYEKMRDAYPRTRKNEPTPRDVIETFALEEDVAPKKNGGRRSRRFEIRTDSFPKSDEEFEVLRKLVEGCGIPTVDEASSFRTSDDGREVARARLDFAGNVVVEYVRPDETTKE